MTGRDDAALVSAARAGDADAFGEMFDRYGQGIYSFCLSRLRNTEQAADATQNVFVRAIEKLDGLRNPERLRAWLFAIAQRQIVDAARARTRTSPAELADMADETIDLSADLIAAEHAQLLWDAAGSLQPRDMELLELEYRHGLEGSDLADALGVTTSHLHVLQSRSRDRVGAAVGALVLARTGTDRCADLAGLLDGWNGDFTLAVRSQLTRHANGCETCSQLRDEETRSELRRSLLPLAAVPLLLRSRTLFDMEAVASMPTAAPARGAGRNTEDWQWRRDGFPAGRDRMPASVVARMAPFGLAAVAVLLLIVAGVLVTRGGERGPESAISASVDESRGAGTSTSTGPPSVAAPAAPPESVPPSSPPSSPPGTSSGATESTVVRLPVDVEPVESVPPGLSATASTVVATPTGSTTSTTTTTTTTAVPNLAPSIDRITIEDPVCSGEPADLLVAAGDADGVVTSVRATTPAGTFDLAGDGPYVGPVELGTTGTVDVTITATDDRGSSTSQIVTTRTRLCFTSTSSPFGP